MNWERTRSWFPVTGELAYFNHASVAPVSTRVQEALGRYSAEITRHGALHYAQFFDAEIERVRGRAAELIGASRDEIAFVKNTSEGLGLVAAGLDWDPGDQVVTCDLEYPSNVYPWWSLHARGVETIMLPGRNGKLPFASVERALENPRVRLLALSSVQYGSGFRSDIEALGRLCRERGVLFCLDAIQSVGLLPIDVAQAGVDFLAADGHKWLLSLEGCGIFYCSRSVLDRVTPRVVGWRSVTENTDFDRYHMDLQPGAGRFEEGTPNTAGIFGLGAAIDLLHEIGVEAIAERVLGLTGELAERLEARGTEVVSPRDDSERAGIVAFRYNDEPPKATAARLRRAGVFVSVRRGAVRASPHFYNNRGDMEQLLGAL
ncbi:MAG: aminotransferase class V-fold PLP-dependent enzyme [Deltaproteobacteria bacterium]|nr:aminotransferase class V-fold PLP-dependent enzyme [Deltaproteobacteria bacterium]MBW2359873.1 aminotransferase class V-fold PLP-dependent enzyme [Deltaproteobacteria bacterium]